MKPSKFPGLGVVALAEREASEQRVGVAEAVIDLGVELVVVDTAAARCAESCATARPAAPKLGAGSSPMVATAAGIQQRLRDDIARRTAC